MSDKNLKVENSGNRLHRLATVRKREGVSWASMVRRTGQPLDQLQQQENESQDIDLESLYIWQSALQVPTNELVEDPEDAISSTLELRAQLIKVVKTVMLLREQAQGTSVKPYSDRLLNLVLEVMPELIEVTPWPMRGSPREENDCARVISRQISTSAIGLDELR